MHTPIGRIWLLCAVLAITPTARADDEPEAPPPIEGEPAPMETSAPTADLPGLRPEGVPAPAVEPTAAPPPETAEKPVPEVEVPKTVAEPAPTPQPTPVEEALETKAPLHPASTADSEDILVPTYQRVRPQWAFQAVMTPSAFGGQVPAGQSTPTYGVSLQVEFQPAFVQRFGVLSLGPSLNVYPTGSGSNSPSWYSVASVGAQVKYQARYLREQWVVPYVGYDLEYLSYDFSSAGTGQTLIQGPLGGLLLLLNFLEPSAAGDFYTDFGVTRSYLVGELRTLNGSSGPLTVAGLSWYFGLRVELE